MKGLSKFAKQQRRVKKTPRGVSVAILRLMVPTMFLSGFLNNSPLVAILIPVVCNWADRMGVHPGQVRRAVSCDGILLH